MIKINKQIENNDGRNDIVFIDQATGQEQLIIRQEFYEFYGVSYEEMKTESGVAAFLVAIGLKIAKGISK